MSVLYNIFITIFFYKISIFHFIFSKKLNEWLNAQKNIKYDLKQIEKEKKKNWFHCASLGEYEQIKPIINKFEIHYQEPIIITFFSPTAYKYLKQRMPKKIFLLPVDIKKNMERFIEKINPKNIFIAKNEIWPNMINISVDKSIPIYLLGSKIKKQRIQNIIYGKYYCDILKKINTIFVQDSLSKKLLEEKNINCVLSGDPRVDQVISHQKKQKKINLIISNFCKNQDVIIAGSTEKEDYKYLLGSINSGEKKWIIVPHENSKEEINYITKKIKTTWSLYSTPKKIENAKILIIDKIGILKNIYKYAQIIYIGGGFSKGIHNCLEPAIFGKPLFFGPNYTNFPEAIYFVENKIALTIHNKYDVQTILKSQNIDYQAIRQKSFNYFNKEQGASKKIIEHIIS